MNNAKAAIIFDLDGVLWDSTLAHENAYRQVLRTANIPMPSYSEIAGRRTDEVIAELAQKNNVALTPLQLKELTCRKKIAAQEVLQKCPPVKHGCLRALQTLRGHFRLGLASSASRVNVDFFLNSSATQGLFDVVLSGDDVALSKPSPDIYLRALSSIKVPAKGALVVEDSPHGIMAAKAAGIDVLGMSGTSNPGELEALGANTVFDNLGQLVQHVLANY
jgi:beta-phosphoglucomutase